MLEETEQEETALQLDTLSRMMAQHLATPFPPGVRGMEIAGEDLVLLDANAYGYISGVRDGPLDERRRAGLLRVAAAIAEVLPAIDDERAAEYCTHLRDMAVLAAEIGTSPASADREPGPGFQVPGYRSR
ncbi:hypothetical protein OG407_19795 [Streptomyces sp. NBC_01515]|uniref:hypothetical protein n=1 Tax=Streptomyces sp. NBC_01515 TaxID=2903890 RepID=UPI00386B066D